MAVNLHSLFILRCRTQSHSITVNLKVSSGKKFAVDFSKEEKLNFAFRNISPSNESKSELFKN